MKQLHSKAFDGSFRWGTIEGNEIATYIKNIYCPVMMCKSEEYEQILDFVNYGNTAIFVEVVLNV